MPACSIVFLLKKETSTGSCPDGPDTWRPYKQDLANKTKLHKPGPGLPDNITALIKPTYARLSDDDLLKKCLDGKTQNQNESLNGMIWNRLPKTIFVGADVLNFGAYDAVAHFNIGNKAAENILGETLRCKIQKLQNRAARVIMRANYDDSAGILLDTLHWDNLSLCREKLKAGLMFKTLKGNMPSYLQDMFSFRGLGYNIRNCEIRLNLPKPRTNYLKRSFCYSGATLWNSLPQDIRKLQSFAQFKKAIAEYYNSN